MTSKKYSADIFRHTFLNSIKSALPAALFTFVATFVCTSGLLLAHLSEGGTRLYKWNFEFDEGIQYLLLEVVLIMSGAAVALLIYMYMLRKASTNVFFSVPQSRTSMFLSKYLAGTVLNAASTFLPIFSCGLINAVAFGNSIGIWKTALYISLCLFAVMQFMFSLTALVCSSVGSLIESAYVAAFMLLPIAIKLGVQNIAASVLYGSPYQNTAFGYFDIWRSVGENGKVIERNLPLVSFEKYLMPVNFGDIVQVSKNKGTPGDVYSPQFAHILVFIAVSLLIGAVACVVYKRRKAEKADFLGASKLTTNAAIFSLSLLVSACIIGLAGDESYAAGSAWGHFLVFALVSVVVFLVVQLFILRSIKQLIKSLWMLAIHFGIVGVALLIVATGFFGYSSRMPEADEIKSVAITTETGDVLAMPLGGGGEYNARTNADMAARYAFSYEYAASHPLFEGFTEKEDIELALKIHEALIALKGNEVTNETMYAENGERLFPASVRISYTLKNGKTVNRLYPYATDAIISELAKLTRSEEYKEYTALMLDGTTDYVSIGVYNPYYYETSIGLASADFTALTPLPDYEQSDSRKVLLSAVARDVRNDRVALDMSPTEDLLGYIVIYSSYGYEESDETDVEFMAYKLCYQTTTKIPVYSGMTETVAVLKSSGLLTALESTKKPTEMKICCYNAENSCDVIFCENDSVNLFAGRYYVDAVEAVSDAGVMTVIYEKGSSQLPTFPSDSETVTDEETVAKYIEAMRMYCPLTESGSYVLLRYDDDTAVCGFVPDVLLNK